MDFSGDLASVQQQLARSEDMAARRVRVLEAVAAAQGERILEVGCGGGVLLREIGMAVGPTGAADGVDPSEDQVRAAQRYCGNVAQVRVGVGVAEKLRGADQAYDASVSTQVLEYIADVDGAVAELHRVTRPGGRFVNVATNWGSLFWTGGDGRLTELVLRVWEQHAPHPNLPVCLPGRLRAAGFGAVTQRPLTILNRHFQIGTFCHGIAHLMAAFALHRGDIDGNIALAWIDSINAADLRDELFVSVVPILTTALRIDHQPS